MFDMNFVVWKVSFCCYDLYFFGGKLLSLAIMFIYMIIFLCRNALYVSADHICGVCDVQ